MNRRGFLRRLLAIPAGVGAAILTPREQDYRGLARWLSESEIGKIQTSGTITEEQFTQVLESIYRHSACPTIPVMYCTDATHQHIVSEFS